MLSANLFYNSEIILQKVKKNRWFSHLRVIMNKFNNPILKLIVDLLILRLATALVNLLFSLNFLKIIPW